MFYYTIVTVLGQNLPNQNLPGQNLPAKISPRTKSPLPKSPRTKSPHFGDVNKSLISKIYVGIYS